MTRDEHPDFNPSDGRPLFGIPVAARRIGLCIATGALSLVLVTACGSSSGSAKDAGASASTGASTSVSTAGSSPAATAASSPAQSSSADGQAAAMIMIDKFKYTTPLTVSPGAMVSVMNMDGENHTVTADSGNAFDVKAGAGTTTMFKAPSKPGSYAFHCVYHSNMHGVLIVR